MQVIDHTDGIERTLDIEMGPGGYLEVSCPARGIYFYSEWDELSAERQEFFKVVLAAQARILDTYLDELAPSAGNLDYQEVANG